MGARPVRRGCCDLSGRLCEGRLALLASAAKDLLNDFQLTEEVQTHKICAECQGRTVYHEIRAAPCGTGDVGRSGSRRHPV